MNQLQFIPMVPVKKIRGVYLLWSRGIVVYVGQSENILQRVGVHLANPKKEFDGYCYAVIEQGNLNQIEADLIVRYQTRLNNSLPINQKYVTANQLKKQMGFSGWDLRRMLKKLTPVWKEYYLLSDLQAAR